MLSAIGPLANSVAQAKGQTSTLASVRHENRTIRQLLKVAPAPLRQKLGSAASVLTPLGAAFRRIVRNHTVPVQTLRTLLVRLPAKELPRVILSIDRLRNVAGIPDLAAALAETQPEQRADLLFQLEVSSQLGPELKRVFGPRQKSTIDGELKDGTPLAIRRVRTDGSMVRSPQPQLRRLLLVTDRPVHERKRARLAEKNILALTRNQIAKSLGGPSSPALKTFAEDRERSRSRKKNVPPTRDQ